MLHKLLLQKIHYSKIYKTILTLFKNLKEVIYKKSWTGIQKKVFLNSKVTFVETTKKMLFTENNYAQHFCFVNWSEPGLLNYVDLSYSRIRNQLCQRFQAIALKVEG